MTIKYSRVEQQTYKGIGVRDFQYYHSHTPDLIKKATAEAELEGEPEGVVLLKFTTWGGGAKRRILPIIALAETPANIEKVPAIETWQDGQGKAVVQSIISFMQKNTHEPTIQNCKIRPLAYIEKGSNKLVILNSLLVTADATYSTTGVTPSKSDTIHFLLTCGKSAEDINADELTLIRSAHETFGVTLSENTLGKVTIISNLDRKRAVLASRQQLRNSRVSLMTEGFPVIASVVTKNGGYPNGMLTTNALGTIEQLLQK